MSLREMEPKWIEKFYEIRNRFNDTPALAAPFLSVSDPRDKPAGVGPILLTGKATAGDWGLDRFLSNEGQSFEQQAEERRASTLRHLCYRGDHQTSAFWQFWKKLHEIGSPVIWTNLVKIGVTHGNPNSRLIEEQCELAHLTLKAEIAEYKPALVVLVSSDFAKDQIVYRIWPQKTWGISDFDGTCWIRKDGEIPPVLWTDHPQGKPPERSAHWLEKANWLMRS
jgi:hypothetical protein